MNFEVEWCFFKFDRLAEELWVALIVKAIVRVWIYVVFVELLILGRAPSEIVPSTTVASIVAVASIIVVPSSVVVVSAGPTRPAIVEAAVPFIAVPVLVAVAPSTVVPIFIIVVLLSTAMLLVVSALISTTFLIVVLANSRLRTIIILVCLLVSLFILCYWVALLCVSLTICIGRLVSTIFTRASILSRL